MKRFTLLVFFFCISGLLCNSQSLPNLTNGSALSPNTQKASQLSAIPVNIFTGVPQIGVPIYSYNNSNSGLSYDISLGYMAGGAQVVEVPGTAGLGWYLNAGGVITRILKGAPDDQPTSGYLYAPTIPTDFRSNGDKYYFDSLDTQQDIFQFNFNGYSGKFLIGKNGQIVVIPTSKLKIIPIIGTGSYAQKIIAFRIITENNIKYDFTNTESATTYITTVDSLLFRTANSGRSYISSWYLTKVISSFNTDTIRINYTQNSTSYNFAYPQVTFVRNSDGTRTKTYSPLGTNYDSEIKISSVVFPEKTQVSFIYNSYGISKIKISDSIFRYGYLFDYVPRNLNFVKRSFLSSITPYTSKEKKDAYSFTYNQPYFAELGSINDTIQNQRDYWGFYNGAYNGSNIIPKVNGYSWGANRNPDSLHAITSSLSKFTTPEGGTILYEYELNDHLPYTKDPHRITISPTVITSTAITFNQVFNTKHQLIFTLDSTVSRSGTVPISGTGTIAINIKSTDGVTTYSTYTLSLYDLYYQGLKNYVFNLPNGNYLLSIPAVTGTTVTGSFPINIAWENKLTDNAHTSIAAGGLRVKKVTRMSMFDDPAAKIQQYRYVNADGTSSGFLGDIPKYDYPYQETVNFGGVTTTGYTVVNSEPLNNMDYAQGSPVGYSRVEIYEGTTSHNIGKTVYEFTSMQDINAKYFTATFPYAPQELREWGIGLPKKISIYDTTGRLVKKTINNYGFDSTLFVNNNFKSIKLGNTFTYVNGDPAIAGTPRTRTYVAQDYYPISGRAYIISSFDTLFQANGSQNNSYSNFTYDTNYNVIKVISSYDKNRGLQLEKRMYYPYNYTISGSVGKLRDSGILGARIATEDWITGDANPRIVAGSITDYQQIAAGFIKPLTVYSLQTNKPVPQTTIGTFNPAMLNRNSNYFVSQTNFISYDSIGNLLQVQNAQSGINSATVMDYDKKYTIAKVSNASVNDIAYTSFESDGTGNWTIASISRDITNAITGKKSYNTIYIY